MNTATRIPTPAIEIKLAPRPKYLWLDIETTGVVPGMDKILEVAAVVTDRHLNEIGQPFVRVIGCHAGGLPFGDIRSEADPYVQNMHDKNGLWEEVAKSGHSESGTVAALLAFACEHGQGTKLMLAGASVHFDRGFVETWVREGELSRVISHRHHDSSTLRETIRDLGGETPDFAGDTHRALSDVRASIELAKYVRGLVSL